MLPYYLTFTQADPTERSSPLFAKIKGRAEKDLYDLASRTPSLRLFAARPGYIDPEGNPVRPVPFYMATLGFVLRRFGKGYIIGADPLARALTSLAVGNGEPLPDGVGVEGNGRTLRNLALRSLGGV